MSERRSSRRRPSSQQENSPELGESNVKVVVRCRPLNEQEKAGGAAIAVNCNPKSSSVTLRTSAKTNRERVYTFDDVYGAYSTQSDVYNTSVLPIVQDVLQGFNCTVFAYGQTGTGKTYTMEGTLSADKHCDTAGVIPRSVNTIFSELEKQGREFSIKVSFLELYNEELSDLLSDEKRDLRLFEESHSKKGVMVHGLEEVVVTSSSEVFTLLRKAQHRRQVAETRLNKNSSRSHCVFTITVHTKDVLADGEETIKTGKLHLVDLAGAECIGKSGAVNQRAKEAGNINKSLLTLGRVINALVERQGYVPYRDSKLTRLLQQSLGGTAKTCIIATLTPAAACCDESLSTLEYAHRAKDIRNKPQVNQKMTKQAYMKELVQEINILQRENEALRQKHGVYLPQDRYEELTAGLTGKTAQLAELEMALDAKVAQLNELEALFGTQEAELRTVTEEKLQTEERLVQTEDQLGKTRAELQETKDDFQRHRKALRYTVTELEDTKKAYLQTSQNLSTSQLRLSDVRLQLELLREQLHATRLSWENEQELVKEHRRAEAEVTKQAEELKSTLEYTIHRETSLFEKVDRKTAVEEQNLEASQILQRDFQDRLSRLRLQHSGFLGQSSETLEHLKLRGGELAEQQLTNVGKLQSHLDALGGLIRKSIPEVTESLIGFVGVAGEGLQQMQASAEERNHEAEEEWSMARSELLGCAEEMRKLVAEQRSGLLAWYQHTQSTLERQQKSLEAFATQQDAELDLIHRKVSEAFATQIQNLQVHAETTQGLKAEQLEQNQRLFSEFQDRMLSGLAALRAEQERSLETALEKLQADFQEQQTSMLAQSGDFKHLSASVTSRTKEWTAQQTEELILRPRQELEEHYSAALQKEDGILAGTEALSSAVESYGRLRETQAEESLAVLQERADSAHSDLEEFREKQSVRLQDTAQEHADLLTAARSDLETDHTAQKTLLEASQAQLETLQTEITEFGDGILSFSHGLEERISHFVTEDLRRDHPTGKTPVRQVHKYPKIFYSSRPAEEVINEFRSRHPPAILEKLEFSDDLLPEVPIRRAPRVSGVKMDWSGAEEEEEEDGDGLHRREGSDVDDLEAFRRGGDGGQAEQHAPMTAMAESPQASASPEEVGSRGISKAALNSGERSRAAPAQEGEHSENLSPKNAGALPHPAPEEAPLRKAGTRARASRLRAPSRSRSSGQRRSSAQQQATAPPPERERAMRSSRSRQARASALR